MLNGTSDAYLLGLLAQDQATIARIYTDFAPRIEAMVLQNNGSKEDARDVFQEGLLVFWRKANDPAFKLTSSFYTYLYGVCYFVWQRNRKKRANNTVTIPATEGLIDGDDIQSAIEEGERNQLYKHHFSLLGEECRLLLKLFFQGLSMENIAVKLNIENAHAARNRKYRCQKKLENSILNDPRYSEIRY